MKLREKDHDIIDSVILRCSSCEDDLSFPALLFVNDVIYRTSTCLTFNAEVLYGIVSVGQILYIHGMRELPVKVVSISDIEKNGQSYTDNENLIPNYTCLINVKLIDSTAELLEDDDITYAYVTERDKADFSFDIDGFISGIYQELGVKLDRTALLDDIEEDDFEFAAFIFNALAEIEKAPQPTKADNVESKQTLKANESYRHLQFVVGIDLGHGETSAAICPMQWDKPQNEWEAPIDVNMGHNKKVMPSAITLLPDGRAYIGDNAFDPDILKQANVHVCFKCRPQNIDGENEKLMIRFMSEVYKVIRENVGGRLTDTNHAVYIATPSGWNAEDQRLYKEMAKRAGIPIEGVTKESRAAFIKGMSSATAGLSQKARNGAIVFDLGSSTLDFTYLSETGTRPIDHGYDCGASFIEQYLYQQKHDEGKISEFEKKYPELKDCILFAARNVKEEVYFNPDGKVKKIIHLEELVDDDDLDENVKFVFEPGELNRILAEVGYIGKIEEAMNEYKDRHINNAPVYGVFMTGGASRMNFIKPSIAKCFGISEEQIVCDQDPSLTISRGVAEVASMDLMTSGTDQTLSEKIQSLKNSDCIYDSFVDNFSHDFWKSLTDKIADCIIFFANDEQDRSLIELKDAIDYCINGSKDEYLSLVPTYISKAVKEQTRDIKKEVENIINVYSNQGIQVNMPTMRNVADMDIVVNFSDLDEVFKEMTELIVELSFDWKNLLSGVLTGAGIGAFGILGGVVGGTIGYFLKDSDESKLKKAKTDKLNKEKRKAVYECIAEKQESIFLSIEQTISSAVSENVQLKKDINGVVDQLLDQYREELKMARILIE